MCATTPPNALKSLIVIIPHRHGFPPAIPPPATSACQVGGLRVAALQQGDVITLRWRLGLGLTSPASVRFREDHDSMWQAACYTRSPALWQESETRRQGYRA